MSNQSSMPHLSFEPSTPLAAMIKTEPEEPYLRITEQPAMHQRFRYANEKRYTPLKGANSVPGSKTYPTIEIVNYSKPVVVVVSCVTKDEPHRPHPNKVVGRDADGQKFKDGICVLTLHGPPFQVSFNNFGIQWTKRKDIEESLAERRKKGVNPFKTSYTKYQKKDFALNEVRLCFQAFVNPTGEDWKSLSPRVSEPVIYNKTKLELAICQLSSCSARVNGGDRIILLCEKVERRDIKVKFTEFDTQGGIKWQAYADFQPENIHKDAAITFNAPHYERTDISDPVKVFIQLERPTDKALSKPVEFQFLPNPDILKRKRMRTSDDVRNYMRLHTNSQTPTASMKSPADDVIQNSPSDMLQFPSSQSPAVMGMEYATAWPSQNETNQFLPTKNAEVAMLPKQNDSTMHGDTTNSINQSNQATQQMPTASSVKPAGEPLTSWPPHQFEHDADVDSMTNSFANILNSAAAEVGEEEQGLTTSGLLRMLNNTELLPVANF